MRARSNFQLLTYALAVAQLQSDAFTIAMQQHYRYGPRAVVQSKHHEARVKRAKAKKR